MLCGIFYGASPYPCFLVNYIHKHRHRKTQVKQRYVIQSISFITILEATTLMKEVNLCPWLTLYCQIGLMEYIFLYSGSKRRTKATVISMPPEVPYSSCTQFKGTVYNFISVKLLYSKSMFRFVSQFRLRFVVAFSLNCKPSLEGFVVLYSVTQQTS